MARKKFDCAECAEAFTVTFKDVEHPPVACPFCSASLEDDDDEEDDDDDDDFRGYSVRDGADDEDDDN